jgi:hypothetical protein
MDNLFESEIYPLTITKDRYTGAYSEGEFLAWNLDADEVPDDIYSDDCGCYNFWKKNEIPVGKGQTIREAILDLYVQLKEVEK